MGKNWIYRQRKNPYISEDGFQVIPAKALDEVKPSDYSCIILPGILNPLPALHDDKLIKFLQEDKRSNTVNTAISSASLLLSEAGILDTMSKQCKPVPTLRKRLQLG